MAYIYDIADVWASAGTTFKGIALNVTDTASAAGSLLMDLQVGGSSKFSVDKNSVLTANEGRFGAQVTAGVAFSVTSSGVLRLPVSGNIGFTPTGAAGSVADLLLARDAANTLAQRNGVNAQAFNLYNTYTDASNYERGFMRFVSNVLQIGSEKLGTGTARALEFQTDGTTRMTIASGGGLSTTGAVTFGGSVNLVGSTEATRRIVFNNVGFIKWPSDGVLLFQNDAQTNFGRIMLGGTTSSFPALRRDTTSLQARLADDSAFTNIQGKLTTDTAYTAGAPTATGYIVLFDSTGTAYRVPAVAN